MADIKTHLRELSVGLFVGLILRKQNFNIQDYYCSKTFFEKCEEIFENSIQSANNILDVSVYKNELKMIVDNGYKLAVKICNNKEFTLNENSGIIWCGNDTQKGDPIDLKLGNYLFSLKEESFILKNMGLYSLLNNLTGSNYTRGLHVFETFSKNEYDAWFKYTWNQLYIFLSKVKKWIFNRPGKNAYIELIGDNIILSFNGDTSTVSKNISTNKEFMSSTTSATREKVFSKWIDAILKHDPTYISLKKDCSEKAGLNLSRKITSEYKPQNIFQFFQIWPFDYYYAKTTTNETSILKVPCETNFKNIIVFVNCTYDVPTSQLNIITTFRNVNTNKQLQFRNECRFSHGQFNGTPEAKMYVVKNTPLTELYDPID